MHKRELPMASSLWACRADCPWCGGRRRSCWPRRGCSPTKPRCRCSIRDAAGTKTGWFWTIRARRPALWILRPSVRARVWIPTMSAACSEAKSATYSDFMSAGHSDWCRPGGSSSVGGLLSPSGRRFRSSVWRRRGPFASVADCRRGAGCGGRCGPGDPGWRRPASGRRSGRASGPPAPGW